MRIQRFLIVVIVASTISLAGAWALEPAPPASVGMDADRLADIPARMQAFVEARQIAGAVTLVARRGRIAAIDAVGLADIESNRPMTDDTMFWIASMTKPVAATSLMILQGEGRLSVSDPVEKYLPEFNDVRLEEKRLSEPITIRDLITHTSGIAGSTGGPRTAGQSLADAVRGIAAEPLQFKPGSQWKYSSGLTVAGRIVEVVSGQRWDTFVRERIFQPLGMKNTGFLPSAEQSKRLATIYRPGEDGEVLAATQSAYKSVKDSDGRIVPNPSAGLFSTARDLARFYQMVLNRGVLDDRRILSADAVALMTRLHTGDLPAAFTPGMGFGLGWAVVREPTGVTGMLSVGTFGHGGAYGTQGWIDPQRELILVLLIARSGFGNSDASDIRRAFQEIAVSAVRE